MKEQQDNDTFIENICSTLETSANNIDAATQSRITRARHRALEKHLPGRSSRAWLPATGVVVAACVALVIFSVLPQTQVEETGPLDDFELISNMDNLEVLEELEFYEWLEEYELPT